jgi:F420-non-reducing hydrogenase iron-sulfur subunit
VKYLQDLLAKIGLEPERVQMFQMSSAQASQFAEAAKTMADHITALGPNPLRIERVKDDQG